MLLGRAGSVATRLAVTARIDEQSLRVMADNLRIGKVAMNLPRDVVKFSPDGGAITVRRVRDGGAVRIDVVDSGQGIAPGSLPLVFDMFSSRARQPRA